MNMAWKILIIFYGVIGFYYFFIVIKRFFEKYYDSKLRTTIFAIIANIVISAMWPIFTSLVLFSEYKRKRKIKKILKRAQKLLEEERRNQRRRVK